MKKLLFLLFSLINFVCFSQQWNWTKPSNSADVFDTLIFSPTMAKDSEGNIYIGSTGIQKFDKSNNLLWTKSIGTTTISNLIVASPKIYITGYDNNGTYMASYDTSGNLLWSKSLGISQANFVIGNIIADKSKNLYLTAFFTNSFTIDSYSYAPNSNWDIVAVRVDQGGTVTWSKQVEGNSTEWYSKIGVDDNENIYLSGEFTDSLHLGNYHFKSDGICNQYAAQCGDIFISKYTSAGQLLWATKFGQRYGSDFPRDMQVSAEGNIYICSFFTDTIYFDNIILPAQNYHQVYLVKYDSNGGGKWAINVESNVGSTMSTKLLYFPNGIIYMNGWISSGLNSNAYCVFGKDTLYPDDPFYTSVQKYFVSRIIDEEAVNISEFESKTPYFNIYPNPSNGVFNVNLFERELSSCRILNVMGQPVMKNICLEDNKFCIDISRCPSGIYFLEVRRSGNVLRSKLVKE